MWAFNPHPFEGRSASGTLGLLKEPEAQGQDGCTDEQRQNGVSGDDVPDDANARDNDSTSFSEQASSGDRSVGDYLLYKFTWVDRYTPFGWLREPDSNRQSPS